MNTYWVLGKQSVFEIVKNNKKKILEIVISENKIKEELPSFLNQHKKIIKYKNKIFFDKIKKGDFPDQGYAVKIFDDKIIKLNDIINYEKNFIVLDHVNDPRNIGSVIRTCACFGIKSIIIDNKFYNSSNQIIQKSSSGGLEHVNIISLSNVSNAIRILKKKGYQIYSFSNQPKSILIKNKFWSEYNVFVFGSEGGGIKKSILEISDKIVKIPTTANMPSLNISNAVSAFLSVFAILKN